MVSFNGATSLILGSEFYTQGSHEFLVISISFRTAPLPLELTGTPGQLGYRYRFPLVLTSAITLFFLSSSNLRLPIPGPLIAQHGPTAH